jgi:hypothetical protein
MTLLQPRLLGKSDSVVSPLARVIPGTQEQNVANIDGDVPDEARIDAGVDSDVKGTAQGNQGLIIVSRLM